MVDELELIGRLSALGRLKAYRNLAWLLNWAESLQYPIYTLAAAATRLQDDIWYGGGKDDRTIMPSLAEARFGEAARRDMEIFFERAIGSESPVVAPVGGDSLMEMLDTLADVHGIAYDWIPTLDVQALVAELGSQPIRTYVRAALESLDIKYIYNETVTMTATELTEQRLEEEADFLTDADGE